MKKIKSKKNKIRSFISWFFYASICLVLAIFWFLTLSSGKVKGLTPKVDFQISDFVNPDSEIKVRFSQAVRKETIEDSFKVTPTLEGSFVWDTDLAGFSFIPQGIMEAGQKYLLALQGENLFRVSFRASKEFKIKEDPKIVRISPFKGQGVKIDEKIFIEFNEPLEKYSLDFKVEPDFKFQVITDEEKKEFVLDPEVNLEEDQTYKVEVYCRYLADKKNVEAEKIKEFTFSTLKPLELLSSYPKNESLDIATNQKITFSFSKPVDLESFRESFEITPEFLYKIQPSVNGCSLVIYPNFAEDTDYTLLLKGGIHGKDGSYMEKEQIVKLKTGNASGIIKDERKSTENPAIQDGKYIDINLSLQLMGIYSDGIHLGTFKISSGKSGMRTPTGTYQVLRKERNHWSHKYKLWMPYSLQFTGAGHYIHELPYWPSGYREGTNHLGIPVSHGCVRLGVGSAETVFNFVDIRTPIVIHY
jgi:lipoprotein-anchoring transpeptidase ErfK/SrfK